MSDNLELNRKISEIMDHGAKCLKTTKGDKNPWLRFPPKKIMVLASLLHLDENEKDILQLCRILGNIAEWFYFKERMVDFELTPKKRMDWLKTNIAKPAQQLINAVASDNYKMFVEIYEDFDKEFIDSLKGKQIVKKEVRISLGGKRLAILDFSTRDFNHGALLETLLIDLTTLNEWTIRKCVSLGKKKKRNWNRTRHKEEIVSALLQVYFFFDQRRTSGNGRHVKRPISQTKGKLEQFVQEAAKPILGRHDNLSDQTKKALANYKKLGNKKRFEPTFFPAKWFQEDS
jgi:hypothetical protein